MTTHATHGLETRDLVRQLAGWRRTTAEILYRMPDHRSLLQTFVWQEIDRWDDDPRLAFPRLHRFCAWWNAHLDGPIVQVRIAATPVVSAAELRPGGMELRLH
jgi:uncharacterized protein Usg